MLCRNGTKGFFSFLNLMIHDGGCIRSTFSFLRHRISQGKLKFDVCSWSLSPFAKVGTVRAGCASMRQVFETLTWYTGTLSLETTLTPNSGEMLKHLSLLTWRQGSSSLSFTRCPDLDFRRDSPATFNTGSSITPTYSQSYRLFLCLHACNLPEPMYWFPFWKFSKCDVGRGIQHPVPGFSHPPGGEVPPWKVAPIRFGGILVASDALAFWHGSCTCSPSPALSPGPWLLTKLQTWIRFTLGPVQ